MHSLSMFGARVNALALATSLACFAQAGKTLAQAQKTPIQITADLSDASRKLYHAEVDLPVSAGPLTLTTPQWIPGTHMPAGPAQEITGVVFTANGQPLTWRRDDVDLYQFHLTIPPGVTTLTRPPRLHCYRTDLTETGGAGVGEAAAVSGQYSGPRDSDPAVADRSCWMGNWHRADAGGFRRLPGPCCRCCHPFRRHQCRAAGGLARHSRAIFPRISAGPGNFAEALYRCGLRRAR